MSNPPNDQSFLSGLLAGLPFRVVVRDGDGRLVYSNRSEGPAPIFETTPRPLKIPGQDRQLFVQTGTDSPLDRETQQRLLRAQKMETVGRLTGGIAHEYNNLLGIVLGYSELLSEALEPGSRAQEDLAAIHRAAVRAQELTSQLLAFSRQEILEPRRVTPNERLEGLRKLLKRTLGEDIRLELVLGETPDVRVDPGALEQIVLNLAVNAREAMPTGGVLTLLTSTVEITDEGKGPAAGTYACIAIRDTGPGIAAEELEHIFDPFFTTKDVGAGAGLGLSTVHGIVAQSDGDVQVHSTPGEGATFEVLLPAYVEEESEVDVMLLSSPGGTQTVLVVEDEEPLRKLVCRHLQGAGYNTLSAPDAGAAMQAFERFPGRVHAVLTDVVMPGESGVELVKKLLTKSPKLRVLYMTGYTDESALRHGIDPRRAAILRKPFQRDKLLQRLAQILSPGRPRDAKAPE